MRLSRTVSAALLSAVTIVLSTSSSLHAQSFESAALPSRQQYLACMSEAVLQYEQYILQQKRAYHQQYEALLEQRMQARLQLWSIPDDEQRRDRERDMERDFRDGFRQLERDGREVERDADRALRDAKKQCDRTRRDMERRERDAYRDAQRMIGTYGTSAYYDPTARADAAAYVYGDPSGTSYSVEATAGPYGVSTSGPVLQGCDCREVCIDGRQCILVCNSRCMQ